jgi:ATP-dependent helicase HrpB
MSTRPLPIDAHLPEIHAALTTHPAVIVEAPPGTGKTTRIAPSLLQHTRAGAGRLLLIQPRRIAARAAAARIAAEQGVPLGGHIGYQVRFDNRLCGETRLIAMTPGIALRRLQTDSVLADVSCVLLDEFHERSLEMDLLLGMLRRLQSELRGDDLRLVIMSATLDATGLGEHLGQLPIVRATAPSFPVQLIHRRTYPAAARPGPRRTPSPLRSTMEQLPLTVLEAAQKHPGDLLVFLPGVGEIKQLARELAPAAQRSDWVLMELYGELPPAEQDRVLAPSSHRKIILATNIAETSLTIDGIRVVIDSRMGPSRSDRFQRRAEPPGARADLAGVRRSAGGAGGANGPGCLLPDVGRGESSRPGPVPRPGDSTYRSQRGGADASLLGRE